MKLNLSKLWYNLFYGKPKTQCQWKTWSTCSVVPRRSLLLSTRESFCKFIAHFGPNHTIPVILASQERMKVPPDKPSSPNSARRTSTLSEPAWPPTTSTRTSALRPKPSLTSVLLALSRRSTAIQSSCSETSWSARCRSVGTSFRNSCG